MILPLVFISLMTAVLLIILSLALLLQAYDALVPPPLLGWLMLISSLGIVCLQLVVGIMLNPVH